MEMSFGSFCAVGAIPMGSPSSGFAGGGFGFVVKCRFGSFGFVGEREFGWFEARPLEVCFVHHLVSSKLGLQSEVVVIVVCFC